VPTASASRPLVLIRARLHYTPSPILASAAKKGCVLALVSPMQPFVPGTFPSGCMPKPLREDANIGSIGRKNPFPRLILVWLINLAGVVGYKISFDTVLTGREMTLAMRSGYGIPALAGGGDAQFSCS
jgi:hypothetical protein